MYKDCKTGHAMARNTKEKKGDLVPALIFCTFPLLAPAYESALITVWVELIP